MYFVSQLIVKLYIIFMFFILYFQQNPKSLHDYTLSEILKSIYKTHGPEKHIPVNINQHNKLFLYRYTKNIGDRNRNRGKCRRQCKKRKMEGLLNEWAVKTRRWYEGDSQNCRREESLSECGNAECRWSEKKREGRGGIKIQDIPKPQILHFPSTNTLICGSIYQSTLIN